MHATKLRLATFDAVNHIKAWYRCLIVACLGHLGVVTADAQVQSTDSKHVWAPVEWSGYGGYAFPLRQEMEALVTGHAWGGSVAWGRDVTGGWVTQGKRNRAWQGIQLGCVYAGGPHLGYVVSGLWMIRIPLLRNTFTEWGTGLGWASTPFDIEDAPRSFALGSHLNAGLHAAIGHQWNWGKNGRVMVAADFTHFSNGATALPNLGINLIGLRCSFRPNRETWDEGPLLLPEIPLVFKRSGWQIETALRIGLRDVGLPMGPSHPVSNLHASLHYRTKEASSWSGTCAFDLTYNQSLRDNGFPEPAIDPIDRIQTALLAGGRWHLGKTALTILQGWILSHPDRELGRRHLLVTIQAPICPEIRMEVGLRSFSLRADYPFIGLAWAPGAH